MPVRAESSTKPPVAPGASTRMKSARLRGKAERGRKAGAVGGGPAGADVSPVKAPQTKSGEAQTLRRRARNRISAKLHRAKQRKHLRDMEARLAATTRERDALRVCLLGFLDVPCKCKSADAYRTLAARLINAGHEAAKQEQERLLSQLDTPSVSSGSGASSDSDGTTTVASSPITKRRPLSPEGSITSCALAGAASAISSKATPTTVVGGSDLADDAATVRDDDTVSFHSEDIGWDSSASTVDGRAAAGAGAGVGAGAAALDFVDPVADLVAPSTSAPLPVPTAGGASIVSELLDNDIDILGDVLLDDPSTLSALEASAGLDGLAGLVSPPVVSHAAPAAPPVSAVPMPSAVPTTVPAPVPAPVNGASAASTAAAASSPWSFLFLSPPATSTQAAPTANMPPLSLPMASAPSVPAMNPPVAPSVPAAGVGFKRGRAPPTYGDADLVPGVVEPRPTKSARNALYMMGFLFAFALAGLPFFGAWNSATAGDGSSGAIHIGGEVPRGFGPAGGYYVSPASSASKVPAFVAPAAVPTATVMDHLPQGGARALQNLDVTDEEGEADASVVDVVRHDDKAVAATPADSDSDSTALVPSRGGSSFTPWVPPVSDRPDTKHTLPATDVVPYSPPPSNPPRMRGNSRPRVVSPGNMTLVPVAQPKVMLKSGHRGTYVELSGPLQTYANQAYASFLAGGMGFDVDEDSRTEHPRPRGGNSSGRDGAKLGSPVASFVMCPEAVGSLSSWGAAAGGEARTQNTSAQPSRGNTSGAHAQIASPDDGTASYNSSTDNTTEQVQSPYLVLLVPASSLNGGAVDESAGWMEIGCEVRSVRHVQSVQLTDSGL